jgi:hypothetical protein
VEVTVDVALVVIEVVTELDTLEVAVVEADDVMVDVSELVLVMENEVVAEVVAVELTDVVIEREAVVEMEEVAEDDFDVEADVDSVDDGDDVALLDIVDVWVDVCVDFLQFEKDPSSV